MINTKISFPLYHDKLPIFRSAFLNKDYSVDFYALRERQVLIYVVLKRVSEVITEAFYKDGKETAECTFLISVDYIDKFGQSKDINVLTWKFNKNQADKINWAKIDPRSFNEIALEYHLDHAIISWISNEPSLEETRNSPQASQVPECDIYLFNVNAIFIHANTYCRENFMDTEAGCIALAGARKCFAAGDDKTKFLAAAKILDVIVSTKGRAAACLAVKDLTREVIERSR